MSILTLQNAQFSEDDGVYMCSIEASNGQILLTSQCQIQIEPSSFYLFNDQI